MEEQEIKTKICSKCKIEKELNEFYKNNKNGFRSQCVKCLKEKNKQYNIEHVEQKREYHKNHKEERNEYSRKYRETHKEELNQYDRNRYEKHTKDLEEYYKQYRIEHAEQKREYNKNYKQKNKKYLREYNNQNEKDRRIKDPCFKIRKTISATICRILKENGGSKNGSSILKFLPYSIQELKDHLEKQFESWMDWSNHGPYNQEKRTWQIDHIIPQSLLPYDSMEHPNFKKCWELSNLRPLDSLENMRKSNKIL